MAFTPLPGPTYRLTDARHRGAAGIPPLGRSASTARGKAPARCREAQTTEQAQESPQSRQEKGEFVLRSAPIASAAARHLPHSDSRTHGVAGTSRAARATAAPASAKSGARGGASKRPGRRSNRSAGTHFDRDKVLAAVFPNGVPPKADVIAALAPWLDEAERLSRMR